jgi:predicted hydrolase (HD superfamily)
VGDCNTATYDIIYKSFFGDRKIFTNEFEFDEVVITLMDDTAEYEDVHVLINDDMVFIRQWDDDREKYEVVCMTPKMFYELQEAMKRPAGLFKVELIKDFK